MKAGTYYIGDLCYVVDNDKWKHFCFAFNDLENDNEYVTLDDIEFAQMWTKYGDGDYSSNVDRFFGVDSGSIGCINVKYLDLSNLDHLKNFFYTFEEDFEVIRRDDGTLCFGHVEIYTGEENE